MNRTIMQAKIKSILANDFDITSYCPENPECFGFWVEIEVGLAESDGADLFQMFVCSPKWISEFLSVHGIFWAGACVVISAFDYDKLLLLLNQKISEIEGGDWVEICDQLRLIARWEYEEYKS